MAMALALTTPAAAAERDTRIFEMRTYYANPGKLNDLHARFRDHTCEIFSKHEMENIGYWVPVDNADNKLIYILAYANKAARDQAWKGFMADPQWQSTYKESTRNGKLVRKVDSVFLQATDFSPAIKPSASDHGRVFELRTYQAAPHKLDDLQARFRDHTIALFSKHGMTHFGYWTPVEKKDGADTTLIYLLAHGSQKARDASFAGFRSDPAWTKAKSESEKEGSLTTKVDSLMLVPTDYSPTK